MTSYPSAMRAIAEFRHEVFSILEQVAKPRKKPISQIVGDATFKRGSDEVDDFLDGSDTVLDVFTKGPCSFHIGVSWQDVDRHAGPVRIYASVYFDKKAMFQRVDKARQTSLVASSKLTTKTGDVIWRNRSSTSRLTSLCRR
jgi:hypothetical protein